MLNILKENIMKSLRIVLGALLLGILLVLSLPASGFVPGVEQKAVVAETSQGDTVRMRWYISGSDWVKSFYFYGEEDATYQVEWGDGTTNTYTGQGPKSPVECKHSYWWVESYHRVLLYGVGTVE